MERGSTEARTANTLTVNHEEMRLPVPTSSQSHRERAASDITPALSRIPPLKRRKSAPKALQDPARPPRPMNAWLLFRSDQVRQLRVDNPGMHTPQGELSKIVAELWRKSDESTKLHYEHLAEKEKIEHRKRYPDYKFKYKSSKSRSRDQLPSFHTSSFTSERIESFGVPKKVLSTTATSASGSSGPLYNYAYENSPRPRHDSEPPPFQYQHQHIHRPDTPYYDETPSPQDHPQPPLPHRTASYSEHERAYFSMTSAASATSSGLPMPVPPSMPSVHPSHEYRYSPQDYHQHLYYPQPGFGEFPSQWAEATFAANTVSPVSGAFPHDASSEVSTAGSSSYMSEYAPSDHYYYTELSPEQEHPNQS